MKIPHKGVSALTEVEVAPQRETRRILAAIQEGNAAKPRSVSPQDQERCDGLIPSWLRGPVVRQNSSVERLNVPLIERWQGDCPRLGHLPSCTTGGR